MTVDVVGFAVASAAAAADVINLTGFLDYIGA